MVRGETLRKYGARRYALVLALGLVVIFLISRHYDLDLGRGGSWWRFPIFGGLALVSVGILEVWRRERPPRGDVDGRSDGAEGHATDTERNRVE